MSINFKSHRVGFNHMLFVMIIITYAFILLVILFQISIKSDYSPPFAVLSLPCLNSLIKKVTVLEWTTSITQINYPGFVINIEKIPVQYVIRKVGHGVTFIVKQENPNSKKGQMEVRVTVRKDIL